jgi:uncharacterized OB-fold protein
MAERKIATPHPHADTQPFWDAANAGKLLLKKCQACGKLHYYPRARCPQCLSDKTEWVEAVGRGKIYTFAIVRTGPVPYVTAMVTLDEGITMLTSIVDCDMDRLAIGQAVRLVFKPSEGGQAVPMFTPA